MEESGDSSPPTINISSFQNVCAFLRGLMHLKPNNEALVREGGSSKKI
jgi:hypothetical protein